MPMSAIEILVEALKAEKVAPLPAWLMLFDLSGYRDDGPTSRVYRNAIRPSSDALRQTGSATTCCPKACRRNCGPAGAAYVEIDGPLGTASAPDLARIRVRGRYPVVHIDLTKVQHVQEEGCALLSQELQFLAGNGNGVLFSGAERIERMLRQAVDTMPKMAAFWQLLLDLQRLQGNQKKFESVALEYALYVETDPPAWEPVLMPVLPCETVEEKARRTALPA